MSTSAQIPYISVSEFRERMGQPETIVVDVREPDEISEGKIEGAILINYRDPAFFTKMIELDMSKTYLLFCRAGERSAQVGAYFVDFGFNSVYQLEGGIRAWNLANGSAKQEV